MIRQTANSPRFTLLEVLGALLLSAVLMAGLLGAFHTSLRSRERTQGTVQTDAQMRRTLATIARDVENARVPGGVLTGVFSGEEDSDGDIRMDTLEFATTANDSRDGVDGGDTLRVLYSLEQPEDADEPGMELQRAVWSNMLDENEEETEEVLLTAVRSLEITYFDADADSWLDNWEAGQKDSTQKGLPAAVRLVLERYAMDDEDEDVEEDERRLITTELLIPTTLKAAPEEQTSQQGGSAQ